MLIVLVLSSAARPGQWLPTFPVARAQATAKVAVVPQSIADLSIGQGSTIDFIVNVTDAPAINGYSVILTYNFAVLDALGLDYSGNVLESAGTPFLVRKCIDRDGVLCQPNDGDGVVSFALSIFSAATIAPTSGLLFRVTFQVRGVGFSQIQILSADLSTGRQIDGKPERVLVSTFDGYFTNKDCPPGSFVLCEPPKPVFTWSPLVPVQGRLVTFNASDSSPGPGATITSFSWVWGDGKLDVTTDQNITTHIFINAGNFPVTLKATDSNGISWSNTEFVNVINILIDLAVTDVTASRNHKVLPGTIVTITAKVRNAGVAPQNATVTIGLEGLELGEDTFLNLPPQEAKSLDATWDTTGYLPRVYRVDAVMPPLTNATTGLVIENATANNVGSTWIQLIEPLPAGLGLSLLTSTGLGIVVLGGAGFAVSRIRRRPSLDSTMRQPSASE